MKKGLEGCSGEVSLCGEGREVTEGGDSEKCGGGKNEEGGEK